jgi:MFS transporter, SHS family, lactate transporter
MFGQIPANLNERFPTTEIRATATAFCYHQGAIWGGFCAPVLAYFATIWHLGLAIPMMVGNAVGTTSFIVALLVSPETKGTEMVADLVVT